MTQALFVPGMIGKVSIRNRIVMPAMTTRTAAPDGMVTDDCLAYYRARAQGGAGLITVEMASPTEAGRHRAHELGILHDRYLPGLSKLAAAIHDAGARASIQLGHAGGHTRADVTGRQPLAPSAVPHPVFERDLQIVIPKAMDEGDIEETIAGFAAAARRARLAGFDAVEIHAAHGYLISQFLCPAENHRQDRFGGSLENRARFGLEVLHRIKAEVPGIAVIFRLSVECFFDGGLTFAEGSEVACWAAAAGADAIHVSAGHYRSRPSAQVMMPPMAMAEAPFLGYAAEIRKRVAVPVIAVGRLGDPKVAAAAVASGKADFVALGRPLLADPDWAVKTQSGRAVRRCLACNSCIAAMHAGGRVACIVNPVAGRESDFAGKAPSSGRSIAVIGAGPAGLSYAALLAGHNRVTVFERAGQPGGALLLAGAAPLFQGVEAEPATFRAYIESLTRAAAENGVVFRFGVDVAGDPPVLAKFDRIVVATGADYRFGLGAVWRRMLRAGVMRWPGLRALAAMPAVRDWFYYRARLGRGSDWAAMLRPGQELVVIGDAARAGKTGEAVMSAFVAAFGLDRPKQ